MPLGIEKGRPFYPEERQKSNLLKGAAMGELMARNLHVNPRYAEPYRKRTHWYKSFDFTIPHETENRVELDERTTCFHSAVTISEGRINPVVGKCQVYMTTKPDATGTELRAVPVGQSGR